MAVVFCSFVRWRRNFVALLDGDGVLLFFQMEVLFFVLPNEGGVLLFYKMVFLYCHMEEVLCCFVR
jgi:hypothetical protein